MELMVPCGFIRLKLGLEESTKIILKTLEVNDAKGRRKHVRASCKQSGQAVFNVRINNELYSGKISDISSAGMAVIFDQSIKLEVKTWLNDVQLRLKGILCRVSGTVVYKKRFKVFSS